MARPDPPAALFRANELRIWAAGYLLVAVLLAVTGFASDDPDSALHAALSARLSEGPASHWIVPEWWGNWDSEGLYREHPVGVLLIPTMLASIGVPAVPASYIVGVAAGLAALLLIGHLVSRLGSAADGRAAMVLLQLMPVAFLFRIRANHEYPMLVCLLLVIVGLEGVQRSWRWGALVAAALTAAMLIKGVFVVIVLAGAGLWVLVDPMRSRASFAKPIAAVAASLVAMAGVAWLYDQWYVRVAGETFWWGYWQRQMAPLTVATPVENSSALLRNIGFYGVRLLWHPAPWSLALIAVAWRAGAAEGGLRGRWAALPAGLRRGLIFGLGFAALSVFILSPASRFAERYTFSAAFAVGTCGAVAAYRGLGSIARLADRLDAAIPAFPAVLWTGLMLLRIFVGPYLPRIT